MEGDRMEVDATGEQVLSPESVDSVQKTTAPTRESSGTSESAGSLENRESVGEELDAGEKLAAGEHGEAGNKPLIALDVKDDKSDSSVENGGKTIAASDKKVETASPEMSTAAGQPIGSTETPSSPLANDRGEPKDEQGTQGVAESEEEPAKTDTSASKNDVDFAEQAEEQVSFPKPGKTQKAESNDVIDNSQLEDGSGAERNDLTEPTKSDEGEEVAGEETDRKDEEREKLTDEAASEPLIGENTGKDSIDESSPNDIEKGSGAQDGGISKDVQLNGIAKNASRISSRKDTDGDSNTKSQLTATVKEGQDDQSATADLKAENKENTVDHSNPEGPIFEPLPNGLDQTIDMAEGEALESMVEHVKSISGVARASAFKKLKPRFKIKEGKPVQRLNPKTGSMEFVRIINEKQIQDILDDNSQLIVEIMTLQESMKGKKGQDVAELSERIAERQTVLQEQLKTLAQWADKPELTEMIEKKRVAGKSGSLNTPKKSRPKKPRKSTGRKTPAAKQQPTPMQTPMTPGPPVMYNQMPHPISGPMPNQVGSPAWPMPPNPPASPAPVNFDPLKNAVEVRDGDLLLKRKPGGASKYLGVYYEEKRSGMRWSSQITYGGKQYYLGRFHEEIEAARAYTRAYMEVQKFGFHVPRPKRGIKSPSQIPSPIPPKGSAVPMADDLNTPKKAANRKRQSGASSSARKSGKKSTPANSKAGGAKTSRKVLPPPELSPKTETPKTETPKTETPKTEPVGASTSTKIKATNLPAQTDAVAASSAASQSVPADSSKSSVEIANKEQQKSSLESQPTTSTPQTNGGEQLAADKKRKLEESLSNSNVESDSIGKLDTDTVENGTKKPKTL